MLWCKVSRSLNQQILYWKHESRSTVKFLWFENEMWPLTDQQNCSYMYICHQWKQKKTHSIWLSFKRYAFPWYNFIHRYVAKKPVGHCFGRYSCFVYTLGLGTCPLFLLIEDRKVIVLQLDVCVYLMFISRSRVTRWRENVQKFKSLHRPDRTLNDHWKPIWWVHFYSIREWR